MLLTTKIRKALIKLIFFVDAIDEIPVIFSNLESGSRPKPAHTYYVFRLENKAYRGNKLSYYSCSLAVSEGLYRHLANVRISQEPKRSK